MTINPYAFSGPMTKTEAKATLNEAAPKIVNERKYYGSAVTDFSAIKRRLDDLGEK